MAVREPLLSGARLARALGIPDNTVYSWKRKGLIPFVQPSGMAPLYLESEVRAALERHRKGPVFEAPCSTERR